MVEAGGGGRGRDRERSDIARTTGALNPERRGRGGGWERKKDVKMKNITVRRHKLA
jgi:hypothetical protein